MAEPDYFRMLEIPSPEEERTRSIISRPSTAGGYQGYYQGIASRRGPSTSFAGPQRRLSVKDWQSAQGLAAYEQEARRAVQQLASIEPDDPELPYKQEETLLRSRFGRELVKDPRVVSVLKNRTAENLRLQKQFQDDPDSQTDYLIARREGADPRTALGRAMQASELRKNRLWFAEKGGDLEAFDSGQFMRNGRFDRAAAQAYVNKLPPKKKAEDAKPWQERLSYKEGEAIREAARAAKAGTFQDFEDEFTAQTTKEKEPFKGTRDEYVKQFKGDPDFNAYRQRRLMETGQNLMDEYGLSQEEAAQVLGIRPQLRQTAVDAPETPAAASSLSAGNLDSASPKRGPEAMFEGVKPTSLAQVEGVSSASASPAPVSQADLKRVEPVSFESLRRQRQSEAEGEKRAREEEFLARQKQTESTSAQWETAKNELLQAVTPADLDITELDLTGETARNPYAIIARMGKKETEVAFKDPKGKDVLWGDVLNALVSDPRWKGESATPKSAVKDFSSLWGGKKG